MPGRRGVGVLVRSQGLRRYDAPLKAIQRGGHALGGGVLLALGLATPLAAAAMLNAIFAVHAKNGFWNTEGGWEMNLLIITPPSPSSPQAHCASRSTMPSAGPATSPACGGRSAYSWLPQPCRP